MVAVVSKKTKKVNQGTGDKNIKKIKYLSNVATSP